MRKIAIAVNTADYDRIAPEVSAIAEEYDIDLCRTVETPQETYVCLYWDNAGYNSKEVEALFRKLEHMRHSLATIAEDGEGFLQYDVEDDCGRDEEFANILSLEQNICFWNEGDVLSPEDDYVPVSRKRLIELLNAYNFLPPGKPTTLVVG